MSNATSAESSFDNLKPVIVTPDEGEAIRPFGLDMRVMLTTEQTGGALAAVHARHEPGEGPIDPVHYAKEEYFLVIEGKYEVTVGDVTRVVGPGTICFIPRNFIHSFKNIGETSASMIDWSVPGGQDKYFRIVHQLGEGGGFDAARIVELSHEHDTAFPKWEAAAE
jgi:mannose-6-phosphate isomerase-like protein (cupin superfamily)